MSTTENNVNIPDLLQRLGAEAIVTEGENHGLSPRGNRMRCPFEGCAHKGSDRARDVVIHAGNHPRIFCWACETKGDLLDLVQRVRGLSKAEAIAHLTGQPVTSRPSLRVVPSVPEEDPDKLKPAEAKRIWDSMAPADAQAHAYLEGRGLGEADSIGLVKYASEAHFDGRVKSQAKRGYKVALLLTDVVGNARGVQMRLMREPRNSSEPKVISVKGSAPSKGFFGRPELVEAQPIVCVTEGMADTLAVSAWTNGREGVTVVGASGKGNIPKLGTELELAGIPVEGKLFVFFPQNDRPKNESRRSFMRLAQLLLKRGAAVVHVNTHEEYKDIAQWLQSNPDAEWPPEDVKKKLYEPQPGDDADRSKQPVLPQGLALAIPAEVRTERFAQDFTTLCALLDDPMHREPVMGRGELEWCEMTWRVRFAGREITETDLTTIRLGLEKTARSTDGKPLKFSELDIGSALSMLSRKRSTHPVREWLKKLHWDNKERIMVDLPCALGHESNSFAATLLRRWMVSAVARAMNPGCKMDTVLVLTGNQGDRKSTFFDVLGAPWFTDSPVQVGDKDGKLVMRRAWIVEWAELESMKRARDQESLKAFLSARVDWFRKPYGREIVEAPRHCVIVGTSNPREILSDVTGHRRFWCIDVKGRIQFEWVRAHREQLWAEAVHLHAKGEQWWLTDEEEQQLTEANKAFEMQHPWTDVVRDYLETGKGSGRNELSATELLVDPVGMDMDRINHANEISMGRVMKALGWEKKRRRRGDGVRWVYCRPGVPIQEELEVV